jgi:hypothetical protein
MLDADFLKTILGMGSLVAGAVSGAAALFVDFRDKKTGKITKWGKYALGGILVSLAIGTSNAVIDYGQSVSKARQEMEKSREAAEKTLQIVTDLQRILTPLTSVKVSYTATYAFDVPELASYRSRLKKEAGALPPKPDFSKHRIFRSVGDLAGRLIEIAIEPGSPLYPTIIGEPLAYEVIRGTGFDLEVYKNPVAVSDLVEEKVRPDIKFQVLSHKPLLVYRLEQQLIQVESSNSFAPKDWFGSGKIVSLMDFPGCQVAIRPHRRWLNPPGTKFPEKAYAPEAIDVTLDFPGRDSWELNNNHLSRHIASNGWPVFLYTFPATFDELIKKIEARTLADLLSPQAKPAPPAP